MLHGMYVDINRCFPCPGLGELILVEYIFFGSIFYKFFLYVTKYNLVPTPVFTCNIFQPFHVGFVGFILRNC